MCHVDRKLWHIISVATGLPKPLNVNHIARGFIRTMGVKEKGIINFHWSAFHIMVNNVIVFIKNDYYFDADFIRGDTLVSVPEDISKE